MDSLTDSLDALRQTLVLSLRCFHVAAKKPEHSTSHPVSRLLRRLGSLRAIDQMVLVTAAQTSELML